MSVRRSAAFSLVFAVLVAGGLIPGPSRQAAPVLTVDDSRPAPSLTSRGGRLVSDAVSSHAIRFTNPVYTDPDDRFSKDPAVIEYGGRYYIYYFGFAPRGRQAIKVASSEDLANWRYEGVALEARKDGEWDADLIWAPDVVVRGGLFYMYYAGGRLGPDGDIDWSTMRIGLAVSREPTGRFVRSPQNPILTPPFGNGVIDPDFFADDDGNDYLYYVVQTSSSGHWEEIRVQRIEGMVRVHDDAKVIEPTADWEGNIVEAPTVFKADGYYYLLYSGGGSEGGQRVGHAFSRVPTPSSRGEADNWKKYSSDSAPQPLINLSEGWAEIAVGSTTLALGPSRQLLVIFQGKSQVDGKFRLGIVGLRLGDRPSPVRLAH